MPASTNRAPRARLPGPNEVGPPTEPAGAPPADPERRSLFRRDVSAAQAKSTRPKPKRADAARWAWADVVLASAVAVLAAFAAATMPPSGLRLALGLAMLLFVPGYLLLQAFAVPVPPGKTRAWQALASLGISPAVVGLAALSTSIVQGGFRLDAIVAVVTLACLGLGAGAIVRRRSLAHAASRPSDSVQSAPAAPAGAPSPTAATAKSGLLRP